MVKQVIVVRKDLNMRKGKMSAQVAHASMKVFFDRMHQGETKKIEYDFTTEYQETYDVYFSKEMKEWMNGSFTKIVVSVNSEQELLDLKNKAKENNIVHALIMDNGLTEFHNIPTYTCLAIGPDDNSKIDLLTKDLPLI